jgi:hypothetical protein
MDDLSKSSAMIRTRLPWKPPALKMVGTVGEVLKGGISKHSPNVADPGDGVGKPPGQT